MRSNSLLILFVFVQFQLVAQKKLSIESIWKNFEFREAGIDDIKMMNDGKWFTVSENENGNQVIAKYNLQTGKRSQTIYNPGQLATMENDLPQTFATYDFNENETKIIIGTEMEQLFRRSSIGEYFIYDIQTKATTKLSTQGKQKYPLISPDGSKCAFVRDNNIFIKDLTNEKEIQITFDGKKNEIINGSSDWVYEEEFELTRAYEWSNDSKTLAYIKFNESKVPQFTYELYKNDIYPVYETFKYPKAGAPNAMVSVHVYSLNSGKTDEANVSVNEDFYIPRIQFTTQSNELCITRMNRLQNKLELLLYSTTDKSLKNLYTETNNYFIELTNHLRFTKNGKSFVWTSEKSGYNHIYLIDIATKKETAITSGNYDVTDFYGYDEVNNVFYYQSAEPSATQRRVFSVDIKGNKKELTKTIGTHSATFSPDFAYFIDEFSNAETPTQYRIMDNNGKEVRLLEDNKAFAEQIKPYVLPTKEFISIPTPNGDLNAWIIKPANFISTKKYPVLFDIYGGPGHNTVNNEWGGMNGMWHNYLAQEGYIVVSVDNRGTGARGETFKKCTYKQLGKLEVEDQINAAKYFQALPYVNPNRIGVFGWSYGGYMSSLCITKGAEVFKMAIAVAPVTNWKFYDSIYTERYMQTPEQNKEGYENNAPMFYANMLKGKFLLIHGLADDNVHVQNSYELVNALNKAGKQFDTYFYPNKNHGIYGGNTRYHLFTKITDYIKLNL